MKRTAFHFSILFIAFSMVQNSYAGDMQDSSGSQTQSHSYKTPIPSDLTEKSERVQYLSGKQRGLVSISVKGKNITIYKRSYALVIGIDHYTNGWPVLGGAIEDAKAVATELKGRFGSDNVTLLTSDTHKLTKSVLAHEISRFLLNPRHSRPDARLFIWFAGHGHSVSIPGSADQHIAYIIGADAPSPPDRPEDDYRADAAFQAKAIPLSRFKTWMRQTRAKHVMTIFDSCFSGGIFSNRSTRTNYIIRRATTLRVRQFISSGQAGQEVSDDGQFRKRFLDAISGRDPHADLNGDGYVLGSELGHYLNDKITKSSFGLQTPRYGILQQIPFDRGDFVFRIPGKGADVKPDPDPDPDLKKIQQLMVSLGYKLDLPNGLMNQKTRKAILSYQQKKGLPADGQISIGLVFRLSDDVRGKRKEPASEGRVSEPQTSKTKSGEGKIGNDVSDDTASETDCIQTAVLGKVCGTPSEILELQNTEQSTVEVGADKKNQVESMYARGLQNLHENNAEAVIWFRKAAEHGHASGMRNLGIMYGKGYGVVKDEVEAARWIKKAAENGDARSMYLTGWMYRRGRGVDSDINEAVRWYRKAALNGDRKAMNNLGWLYLTGRGVEKDCSETLRLWKKSAQDGSAMSMNNLGWIYQNGKCGQKEYEKAIDWYEKASTVGHARAMYNLAWLYDRGKGVETDSALAARWLLQAIKAGHNPSIDDIVKRHRNWRNSTRKELQLALNRAGLYEGSIDGVFDQETINAIRGVPIVD